MSSPNSEWQDKRLQLKYSISDLCLFRANFRGTVYRCPLDPSAAARFAPEDLPGHFHPGQDFAALRDLRIPAAVPALRKLDHGFLYTVNQTRTYFIDLRGSFDDYLRGFSSKTRSTVQRKVRKFGAEPDFRVYRSPEQLREYYPLARAVAAKTYQERLFQGALPADDGFREDMFALAGQDRVRGYLLFQSGEPVAYLYVPVEGSIADYAYLGYDPKHADASPGTVLLYLALRSLFEEARYTFFNMGFGENQTKTTFCTGDFLRADVYYFPRSTITAAKLHGHAAMESFSAWSGRMLDRLGLRRLIRRFLRSSKVN